MGSNNIVVVGIDPKSDNHTDTVRWAQSFAGSTNAQLELVAVWHGQALRIPGDPACGFTEREARRAVDQAANCLTLPPEQVTKTVLSGFAGEQLVRHSRDSIALVVGASSRPEHPHEGIGSVSRYCVNHANVPVVVVRKSPPIDAPLARRSVPVDRRTACHDDYDRTAGSR